jgi:rare lipoprotein A
LRRAAALAAALVGLVGCHLLPHRAAPPAPHYVLGTAYQADGVWHYPRPQFDLDETGLAVATSRAAGLTADGEAADPKALAAAHPSLQLPALARVTNLDTGLQVLVRVNDRGPVPRGRMLALTPRAIALLGGAGRPVLRVRLQVLEAESRELAADLAGADGPVLPVAAAPQAAVRSESLPPPPGVAQAAARPLPAGPQPKAAPTVARPEPVPLRLPEQVFRVPARPGPLYVELGAFSRLEYADLLRRRMAALGAETSTDYDAPRDRAFLVRVGPLATVADADAVLGRALGAGVQNARIVAE